MQAYINTAFGKKMAVQVIDTREGYFGNGPVATIISQDGSTLYVAESSLSYEAPLPQADATDTGVDLQALPEGTIYVAAGSPLQFFKVDHVADGKWAGWVFVKRQAGDNFDRVGSQRPGGTYKGAFASLLADEVVGDTPAAMQAYGREIGRCGNCNRTLTDEESRQRGIGPDCWAALQSVEYWLKPADRAALAAEAEAANAGWAAAKAEFASREAAQEAAAFLADARTWRS